jgi:hypothetical protein
MDNIKYYYGNGKKRFEIEKILRHSNITKEHQQYILDEIDAISKAAQNANDLYEKLKHLIK